ncbi:hypothetical protein BS50DRAFT_239929 [Corynespora cassiicola Philippines]|uniref:Uncharacterized protein n=1 Tax=Corynespora cassiicola Philippines TaxID=1448308 RepID=A0A2T2P2N4_CORCC|nr:hypothetical protein BS50DRAFT_239929 [Corynespora cassiicola Philippines]
MPCQSACPTASLPRIPSLTCHQILHHQVETILQYPTTCHSCPFPRRGSKTRNQTTVGQLNGPLPKASTRKHLFTPCQILYFGKVRRLRCYSAKSLFDRSAPPSPRDSFRHAFGQYSRRCRLFSAFFLAMAVHHLVTECRKIDCSSTHLHQRLPGLLNCTFFSKGYTLVVEIYPTFVYRKLHGIVFGDGFVRLNLSAT